MIVIGSKALSYHIDVGRKINDLDIVGTYEEITAYIKRTKPKVFYPFNGGRKMYMKYADGSIVEADIAWPNSVEERLLDFVMSDGGTELAAYETFVPRLNVLYMLKMSHRYLKNSPHFLKTRQDIRLMRSHGAVILPAHEKFYQQRMKDTYVYSLPRLNVSKDAFFDEVATGVKYTYDHDSIHEAVKHLDKPAYKYYSGGEVWSDKEKFFAQPEYIRLHGVLEEAYVLSLERSLIPFPGGKTPKEAFDMALMKVCTSITSGFFREFAWESYATVQAMYSDDYVERFRAGAESGVVNLSH
jgi:hypothetical protein